MYVRTYVRVYNTYLCISNVFLELIDLVWAWEHLPESLVRWAWRSRGYTTFSQQAQYLKISEEQLRQDATTELFRTCIHAWLAVLTG